jgi:phenylalanyl-tRNA synthetase beta chain
MLFSRDWLGQYVELPDDTAELARRLTGAGLAVEHARPSDDGSDVLLDVEVTTNRPDCMNHFGLAREVAVLLDRPLLSPRFTIEESADPAEAVAAAAAVTVEDPAGCPRFVARVVRGVVIGDSPAWLRKRLEAIGLRSINNVVDVTNFVLWELGQPLHAYDLAKLAGSQIVVRRARANGGAGERLVTLDGVERVLTPEMLVIADAERPVGLAGVMGGLDSEVTAATVDILLESAHFDRRAVRQASRTLGLHTDASHRFERGADPEACLIAADRAAALLAELAGGQVLTGAIDVRSDFPPHHHGRLDLARLEAFAGVAIPAPDVERWLTGLGFAPKRVAANGSGTPAWDVTVPSWRIYDIEPRPWVPASSSTPPPIGEVYPADLYEEVLRLHGFDAIPAALPALGAPDAGASEGPARRQRLRDHLAACGLAEAIHFSFVDPAADAAFPSLRPAARPLRLANPISERTAVMRRSLVPSLVESARFNQRRGAAAVRLFEVATVFYESTGDLPEQPEHLGLVCGGTVGTPWDRPAELDFFDLKGVIESLAEEFGVELGARPAELPGLLPGSTAELFVASGAGGDRGDRPVGYLGRVAEGEGYPLYVAELAVDALSGSAGGSAAGSTAARQVENPSRFPGISADVTLTHPLDVPWSEIRRAIEEHRPPNLVDFGLTVRYRGEGVPEGAVNTTIHFLYTARDRSLTQDEVNERQTALVGELERRFGWKS